jgi:hypothetical protein
MNNEALTRNRFLLNLGSETRAVCSGR